MTTKQRPEWLLLDNRYAGMEKQINRFFYFVFDIETNRSSRNNYRRITRRLFIPNTRWAARSD